MRPLFAITPLALAFVLLGPNTSEARSDTNPSLVSKVWHMMFDHDSSVANHDQSAASTERREEVASARKP